MFITVCVFQMTLEVATVCCEEIGHVFLLFVLWQPLGNAVNIAWGFLNEKTLGHDEVV